MEDGSAFKGRHTCANTHGDKERDLAQVGSYKCTASEPSEQRKEEKGVDALTHTHICTHILISARPTCEALTDMAEPKGQR